MSERRRSSHRRRRQMEEERLREERRRRIARARRRRQVIRRRRMMTLGGLLLLAIVIGAAAVTIHRRNQERQRQEEIERQKQEEEAALAEEENNTLHIRAVGDNLIHEAFIEAGRDNDWDFDFLYENIRDDISEADLASVNQETPLTTEHENAAGYPDFNTPSEVGDALADAGFDIVTQATEHAFDQEETGIKDTISFWEDNHENVTLLGIHNSENDPSYQIIEEKNFKIAVMNYSTMLSENHSIPEESSHMVNIYSEEQAQTDLEAAKEEADVTIVYLHGGQDESVEPEERLKERVQFLTEQGADVIICSHPHILKGYEKIERSDGKETLVYYSLGNFVSDQASLENLLGGMADFTLKKNGDEITIEDYSMIPLVMHYNEDYTECSVYKLEDYTDELAQEHGIHEEDPEAEFTVAALEEAADAAGELQTEWDFQTDSSDESDNTDSDSSGESSNTENTDSQQDTESEEDGNSSSNSSLSDTEEENAVNNNSRE
ncbi:MAG TPA: CapA family protein [Candidatus Blautia merdigallinarum]|uniref:CapA family protein n=1 Tax=Candidatus Blautia merdigallinarum TaxID=2838495 RepID=A0A9D2N6B1_9FIRM|nr:CapA family protein [Candidatus Blautia merdigallinarum]